MARKQWSRENSLLAPYLFPSSTGKNGTTRLPALRRDFPDLARGAGVSLKYSVYNMFSSSTPKKTHNAGIASRPSLLRGGSIAALVHGGCLLLDYVPVVAHGHQGHRWWQRKGWRSCRGLWVPSLLMACRYFLSHPCVSSWPLPVGWTSKIEYSFTSPLFIFLTRRWPLAYFRKLKA